MGMAYFALIISLLPLFFGERKEASSHLNKNFTLIEKDTTVISRLQVTLKFLGIEAFCNFMTYDMGLYCYMAGQLGFANTL